MNIMNRVICTRYLKSYNMHEEYSVSFMRKKKLTHLGAARLIAKKNTEDGYPMKSSEINVVRIETMIYAK